MAGGGARAARRSRVRASVGGSRRGS
jgi:hypothetical protein